MLNTESLKYTVLIMILLVLKIKAFREATVEVVCPSFTENQQEIKNIYHFPFKAVSDAMYHSVLPIFFNHVTLLSFIRGVSVCFYPFIL